MTDTLASQNASNVSLHTLRDIPEVRPGDDLGEIISAALAQNALALQDNDIVVLAQKIVSKAEHRLIPLASVTASPKAQELAAQTDKDPRLVQLILDESESVVRQRPGLLIMRHKLGFVQAHAGIDQSNVDQSDGETALLLPADPDASARKLRSELQQRTGCSVAVMIVDSMNRPWRLGTIGQVIGIAGFHGLEDLRGGVDAHGRELAVSVVNRADSIAAMATLMMGESVEGTPAVIVRGIAPGDDIGQSTAELIRPLEEDLFK